MPDKTSNKISVKREIPCIFLDNTKPHFKRSIYFNAQSGPDEKLDSFESDPIGAFGAFTANNIRGSFFLPFEIEMFPLDEAA